MFVYPSVCCSHQHDILLNTFSNAHYGQLEPALYLIQLRR